jgi:hypothetical protein
MQSLVFKPFQPDQQVSIEQLKFKFEQMGAKTAKATLLARFLVEP